MIGSFCVSLIGIQVSGMLFTITQTCLSTYIMCSIRTYCLYTYVNICDIFTHGHLLCTSYLAIFQAMALKKPKFRCINFKWGPYRKLHFTLSISGCDIKGKMVHDGWLKMIWKRFNRRRKFRCVIYSYFFCGKINGWFLKGWLKWKFDIFTLTSTSDSMKLQHCEVPLQVSL